MNANGMSSITGDLVTDLESANGLVSPSPTSIDVEKKELAGNHVLMIKIWEMIRFDNSAVFYFTILTVIFLCRQYSPGLLQTIGDRPPRVGAAGQIAVVYVFVLQLTTIYMYFSLKSCHGRIS